VGADVGSNFFLSSCDLKLIKVGNKRIILRPSSMIGVRQYEQVILQGSLCSTTFSLLSYHTRLLYPFMKLMSCLWKIAAH
jgi:hypothetical protein